MSKKKVLCFEISSVNHCCGLVEIGDLEITYADYPQTGYRYTKPPPETAIATTIPSQVEEIAALEKLGFEPLRSFRGNSSNIITLWLRVPPGRVPKAPAAKPRASRRPVLVSVYYSRATQRPVTEEWALRNPGKVYTGIRAKAL